MDVDEAIRTRRTNKVYLPEPLTADELAELFELARWAPNHHLTNPWRFRVVGPQALAGLKQATGDEKAAAKLDRAPTLVAISVVQTGDAQQDEEDVCATACAVYAVMLGAHARGMASYWRTPEVLRTAEGRAVLGMAEDEHPLGLLHLGRSDRAWQPPERAPVGEILRFLA